MVSVLIVFVATIVVLATGVFSAVIIIALMESDAFDGWVDYWRDRFRKGKE